MSNFGRRLAGALFGTILGMVYALVSSVINRWMVTGISLYSPPPGLLVQMLLTVLLGTLIGLITCWPESNLLGIFLGGLVAAGLITAGTFSNALTTQQALGSSAVFYALLPLIYIFLPLVVVGMVLPALIRWSINVLIPVDSSIPINLKKTSRPALLTLFLAVLVASFNIYSSQVRLELRQMDALVKEGMQAASQVALPEPLQAVSGFLGNANGRYSLEWAEGPDAFKSARPLTTTDRDQATITVRFENGFSFVCLFLPPAKNPVCEGQ
jgi:hypothetical protein